MEPSVFLALNLPNAATWFYFSLLLVVAAFFQFARPLSVRNLDLLTLYLLVPGFLLLQEAHGLAAGDDAVRGRAEIGIRLGYAWLLAGSAYWFARSLLDLALVRRAVAAPNLTTGGMAWLGTALAVGLVAVAVQRGGDSIARVPAGPRPIPIDRFENGAAAVVHHAQAGPGQASPADVRSWVERALAVLCHASVVAALVLIGVRHFQDAGTGVALGTMYLLVPYTAFQVGQFHVVWPAAFVTWAVFCYRRPAMSGWLLGVAAGSSFVPALLVPVWASFYARGGLGRFLGWFGVAVGLSLGVTAGVLWWDGWLTSPLGWQGVADWLPWKRATNESLWTGVHGAYRLPIFVLYVGFLVAVTIWPSPKDVSHLVALSAAVLIGVQFWHADRGGLHVLWYLPLVLLMVFRPNLAGLTPPTIEPNGGLLSWAGAAWRRVRPSRPAANPNELAI